MRALAALALLAATPAFADSEEAWEAFREEVRAACAALAGTPEGAAVPEVTVEVNPFGSQSYGAALVTVAYSFGTDRRICIFDKTARTAELTEPFTPEQPEQ
jgi:hypothetical protein